MQKKANAFIHTGTSPRQIPVIGFGRRLAATLLDGQADFYGEGNIDFMPADTKPGWLWLAIWLLIALVAPSALLSSLFIIGPALGRVITDLLVGLR